MGLREWWNGLGVSPEPAKVQFSAELPGDRLISRFISGENYNAVTREEALSIPAVLRGRNLLCSIAGLPLVQYDPETNTVASPFLAELSQTEANVVVLSDTIEDLLFNKYAYWQVVQVYADGYPAFVERIAPERVSESVENGTSVIRIDGKKIPWSEIIRFTNPQPGLLHGRCGQTIRRALMLERMAAMYAENPRPLDYFTPKDTREVDGQFGTAEDAEEFVETWSQNRWKRSTAYVPGWLEYAQVATPTPADLQLVEQQKQASLDISNLMSISASDVGVSVFNKTYQTDVDQRKNKVNDTLIMLMLAITQRLSKGDVTKKGYFVEFDLDGYLQADPKTRSEVQLAYLAANVITRDEIRKEEKMGRLPVELVNLPTQPPVRVPSVTGEPVNEIEAA